MNATRTHLLLISLLVCVSSCKKKQTEPTPPVLVVKTADVSKVTATSAMCGGDVSSYGGAAVLEAGVVWDTKPSPDISLVTKVVNRACTGEYPSKISGLSARTRYYVRAFATSTDSTYYGEEKRFCTKSYDIEYVDLGLSVKWSSLNLGADTETESGFYIAWGETETYYFHENLLKWREGKEDGYAWSSYSFTNDDGKTMTKYNNTDLKFVLDSADDAASMRIGPEWRIPTLNEWRELLDTAMNTKWKWESKSKGYRITSKKAGYEGNSILLPATGSFNGIFLDDESQFGNYWAADKRDDSPTIAFNFYFQKNDRSLRSEYRYMGLTIRPVRIKK